MAEPARKQQKPMSEQGKKRKRALDRQRSRTRVNIGQAFSQWRELKEKVGCKADADLAYMLMRFYERSSQGCPPPSKDNAQPLRPPVSSVTSSSDPNSDQVYPTPCKVTDEPLIPPVSSVTGSSDPKSDHVYPTPCKGKDEPLRLPVSSVTGSSDPKSDHVYTTPCKGKDEPLRPPVSSVTGSSDPKSDHVYTTPCKGKDEPLRPPVSSVPGSSDPKSDQVYPTPCKGTDEPLGLPVSSVPGSCDPKRESVYIKEEPVVSSSNEVELDSMASLSDPSSELEQEVKTEPASCEDVSENKENKDEDGDISASLSVGDGYYLVDLGSSSEFVVDEACILELFRSCQRCSRHCRVMKRVQGLKIVVNQRCCYCDNRFEWTNLPDGFSDEEDGELHITDRRQLTAA